MSDLVVMGPIGRGGMGVVELAFRIEGSFRRALALKRLNLASTEDPSAQRALVKEARLSGQIKHPNVVGVLDVGRDERGMFLVMDYVGGVTLRELMEAMDGALPVQIALECAASVARALVAAHTLTADGQQMQVVHRDVTPANILVSYDGVVRLSDFGLARALQDPRTRELLKGTSGYMSPEQLRFEAVDARADLFALGVVLYEMLTGTRLYGDADPHDAARRILHETPAPVSRAHPQVPDEVASLLDRLLAKDPSARPETALEVLRVLELARRRRVHEEGMNDMNSFLSATLAERRDKHALWLSEQEARAARALAPKGDRTFDRTEAGVQVEVIVEGEGGEREGGERAGGELSAAVDRVHTASRTRRIALASFGLLAAAATLALGWVFSGAGSQGSADATPLAEDHASVDQRSEPAEPGGDSLVVGPGLADEASAAVDPVRDAGVAQAAPDAGVARAEADGDRATPRRSRPGRRGRRGSDSTESEPAKRPLWDWHP